MTEMIEPGVWSDVPSPFCGIAADDLKIKVEGTRLKVLENGCSVTTPAFEQPMTDTQPRIGGKPAPFEEAVAKAAALLKAAQLPLIGGLATDVNGMRAALSLADRTGAVVDNMNSEAAMRNILVLQDSGWITTTLSEVKNRTDLLVVVGGAVETLFPRFFERHIWNKDSMFLPDTAKREVVYLGQAPSDGAATSPDGRPPKVLACADQDLPEVVAVLRALVNNRPLQVEAVGGIPVSDLNALADRLKQAKYSVIAWAAGALNFSQAELTVQTVCEMIKELNQSTRCSGLPLGGKEGDQTANQVCAWQTGYPMRTRFARGYPEYDPYLNSTQHLLASGEADALLWVSAYNAERTPPATDIPSVVVGRSGMALAQEPAVFIPVGTPGIDHAGHTYRTDNVVAIRLFKLRDAGLPSTAEVLTAIEQAL